MVTGFIGLLAGASFFRAEIKRSPAEKLSRSAAPPQLCPGALRGIASFGLPVARPRCRK
jgi:hypothetical protein